MHGQSVPLICKLRHSASSGTSLLLLSVRPQGRVRLQPDGVDPNETGGVGGVVIEIPTPPLDVHARQIGIVQRVRGGPTPDDDVALVQLQRHAAGDVLLGIVDRIPDQVHLGCEPEPVVAQPREFGRQTLGDALHLAIHAYPLEVHVGFAKDGPAGGLVHAARFDADEAVLDDVDSPDRVRASDLVGVHEELEGVGLEEASDRARERRRRRLRKGGNKSNKKKGKKIHNE